MGVYTGRVTLVDYTNWRGQRKLRRIVPREIRFGSNDWHPEEQWLLLASDLESGQQREFAMKDIHSWKVDDDQSLPYR